MIKFINGKGVALIYSLISSLFICMLNRYEEAIECYDNCISINPNNYRAWNNKGKSFLKTGSSLIHTINNFVLHQLKQYQKAIVYFNKSLSISSNPLTLQFKADSLNLLIIILTIFYLGMKLAAKQCYMTALQQGSTEQEYIWEQLRKL